MKFSTVAAILSVKISTVLLRIIGRGGTSLPGRFALFFNKNLLKVLAKDITVIMITGTNGKTTTCRIVARIMEVAKMKFFENKSGANLISGITAAFSMNCTITGRPKKRFAVIECDEAAFKTVCPLINPNIIVVTNLFRDQLDRFGEITHTLDNIVKGLLFSSNSEVILNADDSLSFSIKDRIPNKTIFFGMDSAPYGQDDNFISDAPYCIKCKFPYSYKYRTFAHLGSFLCSKCGYTRPDTDYSADNIKLSAKNSTISLSLNGKLHKTEIALPGAYNIYNALAAAATAHQMGIADISIVKALGTFKSGFGRMEEFNLGNVDMHMILVKNPAGLNQVINFLSTDEEPKKLVLILNDNFADGTDISWIWDANFEKIKTFTEYIEEIIVSGTRCEELALRLKYSEINETNVTIINDYNKLIDKITVENTKKTPVYILPTYTAMFDFRKSLSGRYSIRKFWE